MQKHKLVKTGILYMGILLGVFGSWVLFNRIENATEQGDTGEKIVEATTEIPIKDFETESVEQLTLKSKDAAESYARIMAAGQKKLSVELYQDAYEYFVAATELDGLTDDQRDYAYINVYWAAEKLKLTDAMQKAKDQLDRAVFDRYTKPVPQVDQ